MKGKKLFLGILSCFFTLVTLSGIVWSVHIRKRENDPYWQAAKQIYTTQSALQRVDKDWKMESLSVVNPYCYTDANGHTIVYYHCISSYVGEEPSEVEGLNTAALGQVVAMESLENIREYEINGLQAVMGECKGRSYLCWSLTPTDSCVIEFTTGEIAEEDILQVAESVEQRKDS